MIILPVTGEGAAAEEEVNPSSAHQNTTNLDVHDVEGTISGCSTLNPISVDEHIASKLFFQLYIIYILKVEQYGSQSENQLGFPNP